MDLFNELMELFDESGFFGKKKKKGTKTNTESEVTLDSVETTEDELM